MENFLVEAGAELGTYIPPHQAPGKQCPSCRRKNSHPCFFAQGKRLTAHCCRDQSSLMEFGSSSKKKVISVLRQLQGLSGQKKKSLQEIKTQTNQPERRGKRAVCPHVGNLAERSQQASVPAGKAQGGSTVAWQPRKKHGSQGIAGRFSAASSATD